MVSLTSKRILILDPQDSLVCSDLTRRWTSVSTLYSYSTFPYFTILSTSNSTVSIKSSLAIKSSHPPFDMVHYTLALMNFTEENKCFTPLTFSFFNRLKFSFFNRIMVHCFKLKLLSNLFLVRKIFSNDFLSWRIF